jgi:hypothetical protein
MMVSPLRNVLKKSSEEYPVLAAMQVDDNENLALSLI